MTIPGRPGRALLPVPLTSPLRSRAAYAGLLDGLQAMDPGYDFAAIATRGECAQVLWTLSGGGEAGG
jgi:hypothetical protein